MTAQRLTMTVAGLFILVSLLMGHINGQIDLTTLSWSWMVAFVGVNLFQSGFTKWCMMTNILKKLGAK